MSYESFFYVVLGTLVGLIIIGFRKFRRIQKHALKIYWSNKDYEVHPHVEALLKELK